MNLRPSDNTQLYGMNHFFNEITHLYNQKKLPTKILLSGKKGLANQLWLTMSLIISYHIMKI